MAIDKQRTREQANSLYDLSTQLVAEIRKLEQLRADIKGQWCGLASDAFQKQLTTLIADMTITQQSVSNLSATAKNVVDRSQ